MVTFTVSPKKPFKDTGEENKGDGISIWFVQAPLVDTEGVKGNVKIPLRVALIMAAWQAKQVLAFGKFQGDAGSVAK